MQAPSLPLVFLLNLLLSSHVLAEKPRYGTVDISRAFEAYYLTAEERQKDLSAKAKLRKDPRNEVILLLQVEIDDLTKRARDRTLPEVSRRQAYRKVILKDAERRSLIRERDEIKTQKLREIDTIMVKKTRAILTEIRGIVDTIAKEQEIDFVFETGGKTSSQLSALIYIRDATDLTDQVIATLNKNAPGNPKGDVASNKPARAR